MKNKNLNSTAFIGVLILLFLVSCVTKNTGNQESSPTSVSCSSGSEDAATLSIPDGVFEAKKATATIQIDGCSKEAIWADVDWYSMNYLWLGEKPTKSDYQGRFKLSWDVNYVYVLVEITDDYLNPTLKNGIENYWKGDYVEVFIDEDQSGGNHKFHHQAFAYHVSTEGHAIDKSTSEETIFLDEHIQVVRSQDGNKHLWEMAIQLYDRQFDENSSENIPVLILKNKRIGFSIGYGDNDGTNRRENFMGSKKNHGINNDEGYTNAAVFGSLLFVE
ncbi:hypothetical protein F0365_12290 [Nonlabens sp. Ci31]|jgi:hypothetical protein|uniref:sugar-binding protein n=1 Tax=Nonlabens sp. Ci31 TaxID=2608253 RepID=UPI00146318E5|nr:sugar-binding protein [Nonlabens sp. Ci31]QJP35110.1 hypothetical protein F0365_12290 [Nonlabens sp. Ci31]